MQELKRDAYAEAAPFEGAGAEWSGLDAGSWSVPWADLMMVMFVLFAVLYVFKSTNRDVEVIFSPEAKASAEQAEERPDALQGLIGRLSTHLAVGGSGSGVALDGQESVFRSTETGLSVTRDDDGVIRVTMRGGVFFPKGEDGLTGQARQYLKEVSSLLAMSTGEVHVIGHAGQDEVQGLDSFALSTRRAMNVARALVETGGINADRFVVAGRGAYEPETPANLEGGAERNRRTQIVILPGK